MPSKVRIDTCMKRRVISCYPETTIKQAALLMAENNVGTMPVVDENGMLIGVTTMRDVIHIFLPDFIDLLSNINFIKDFGKWAFVSPERMQKAERLMVADIMVAPISVEEDCSLVKALSIMEKFGIADLLIVKEGRLVGIASRVDIGRAFLSKWLSEKTD